MKIKTVNFECIRLEKLIKVKVEINEGEKPKFLKCLSNKEDACDGCSIYNLVKEV